MFRSDFRWVYAAVLLLGLSGSPPAWATGFKILDASTTLTNDVYQLNAQIEYTFSQAALEALENGVPLTIELEMEVRRKREWMWDETIFSLAQRFQLSYHALSRQYLVTNLNSGERHGFPTLRSASKFMGKIKDFPFLDQALLPPGKDFIGAFRAYLDLDTLPPPLRLFAYVSEDWDLKSQWYTWSL